MSDKPIIVDGIKVNITADDIDDVDLAEMLEQGLITSAMRYVFGDEEFARIKDKLRDKETGKLKLSRLSEWFGKVSNILGTDVKN